MTDDEILAKWLCAECYGRAVYNGFDHGRYSRISSNLVCNTQLDIDFNGRTITALKRDRTKITEYEQDYLNPYGYIVGAPQDHQFVNFWDGMGGVKQTCWGPTVDEYSGSYSLTHSFINTQIYFADLRNDLVVYYQETGSGNGSAENDEMLGQRTVYADFGSGPGCQTIWIRDAIKLDPVLASTGNKSEIITTILTPPYDETASVSGAVHIAATDRSGYCGGVSDGCYVYGNYAVIDTDEPYDCVEGSYTELTSPEAIEAFINSWDSFGTIRLMDDFDKGEFDGATSGWVRSVPSDIADGTYPYPDFISIDPLPHGSWCIDADGNYFHSMITKASGVFNSLNGADPNEITRIREGGVVYYPIGPV